MRVRIGACRPLCAGTLIVMALLGAAGAGPRGHARVSSSTSSVALKKGDRGPAVKRLQRSLQSPRWTVTSARITLRAVKRFQRRHRLTADGVVGPRTRKALGLKAFSAASVENPSGGGAPRPVASPTPARGRVRLPRVLRRIAECESGGDPTVVSPDGRYRGKFQFTRATWRALGGTGDPADAAECTQDRLALKLYRRSGTDSWPTCAK